jgi:hypothetical protein
VVWTKAKWTLREIRRSNEHIPPIGLADSFGSGRLPQGEATVPSIVGPPGKTSACALSGTKRRGWRFRKEDKDEFGMEAEEARTLMND